MAVGSGRVHHTSLARVEFMSQQAAGSRARMRMHEGEVDLDEALVERLVAVQFPQLADLPIRAVQSTGTVNAIY